jgi:hypothetical protein
MANNENNVRITQAVLKKTVDDNTKALNTVNTTILSFTERIVVLETKQEQCDKDVDRLQKRSNIFDFFTGLVAFIAVAIGLDK